MQWQVQEAKQQFSEVLRKSQTEGAQIVTRHGEEIAVVISIEEYRRLNGVTTDFKTLLFSGPSFDDLEIDRPRELARTVELGIDDELPA